MQWDFSGYLAGLLTFPFLMLSVPLIIVAGGYWPGRRVKKIIQPLQREVAVSMAREELQKRLRTGGRGYYGKG